MLKAWNAHKLGHAMSGAGFSEQELRRALARSEDALTSSVLGRISYLPGSVAWKVLEVAAPHELTEHPWPGCPDEEPSWHFWPDYEPPEGWKGSRVEPDVVVEWGPWTLIFEVKHHQLQYAYQWSKEILAVMRDRGVPGDRILFVGLGGESAERDEVIAQRVLAEAPLAHLYRLSWPRVHTGLLAVASQRDLVRGYRDTVFDAATMLASAGKYQELGMGSLCGPVAKLTPKTNASAMLGWNLKKGE